MEAVSSVSSRSSDNVSKELTSHSDTAAGEDDTHVDPCSRKRCRDTIQHLQESIAARDCSIREYEKINTAWKRMVGWGWLCSPACKDGNMSWSVEPYQHAQVGEHASTAAFRAGIMDTVLSISNELYKTCDCSLVWGTRTAFLQNGVYETKWKDAHIIAIGFVFFNRQFKTQCAPMHYDVEKKIWIDIDEKEWDDFVYFTLYSSYPERFVRIQTNPSTSTRQGVSPFQITEYEVCSDGTLDVVRMWRKIGVWKS